MARPLLNIPTTGYDPEKAAHICGLLAQGETLTSILRDMGEAAPSRWTIYQWKAEIPEFGTAYDRARDVGFDVIAEDCMHIIEDGSQDWTTRKARDGSEYQVVDNEALGRSKLRAEMRLKLLAVWSPRYRQMSGLSISNPDGGPVEFTDAAASAKIASLLALAQARASGKPEDGSDLA
jgi:hypothetical protein